MMTGATLLPQAPVAEDRVIGYILPVREDSELLELSSKLGAAGVGSGVGVSLKVPVSFVLNSSSAYVHTSLQKYGSLGTKTGSAW